MSSPRFTAAVTSSAVVALLVVSQGPAAGAEVLVAAGRAEHAYQQPRDPRSDVPRPETQRELELKAATAAEPAQLANWFELAKLQEARGAIDDAEGTYKLALAAVGPNKAVLTQSAGFFTRQGRFDQAMTYKNILLRMKAQLEPDAARRDALIAEADALKNQATELLETRSISEAAAGAPAAPPPPGAPVRVGSGIKTPTKIHHVAPVYPQEAQDARVSGMVIIEATIDEQGNVQSAKVLRSIPMLDQAALDAVKGWRFAPTMLNGASVPVIMTVTVSFVLQ